MADALWMTALTRVLHTIVKGKNVYPKLDLTTQPSMFLGQSVPRTLT